MREVYRALAADRAVGYSTVLKFMQIMTEKGSLVRDEDVRPQIYRAHGHAARRSVESSGILSRVPLAARP